MNTQNEIYICSDLHFGHEKLYSKLYVRPEDFQVQILRNFMAIPWQPGDVLINCGDLALYKTGEAHSHTLHDALAILGVNQLLTLGNHDPASIFRAVRMGTDVAVEQFVIKYGGIRWVFSHEPVDVPEGSINVHGHFHEYNGHRGKINPDGSATSIVDKEGTTQHFRGLHILISSELMDYRPIPLNRLMSLKWTPAWKEGRFERHE